MYCDGDIFQRKKMAYGGIYSRVDAKICCGVDAQSSYLP